MTEIFENISYTSPQTAKELLCEMNPDDVDGHFTISTVQSEIQKGALLFIELKHYVLRSISDANYIKQFNLVVLSNPTPALSQYTASICWDQSVPLVIVRSYGFIGTYIFQSREEIGIIESRPDAELPDLRLNSPFHELEVQSFYILIIQFMLDNR
jgi:hypothetical protein